MEVTPIHTSPWVGNHVSFGSRNLMHNKVMSGMGTQVILPDKPLHKAESPTNTLGSGAWTEVREIVLSLHSHSTTFTPLPRPLPFQLKQKQHQAAKDIC